LGVYREIRVPKIKCYRGDSALSSEETLEEYVNEKKLGKWAYLGFLVDLYREWVEDRLEIEDPEKPKSFAEFVSRADYSTWFYSLTGLTVATVILVLLTEYYRVSSPARYVLGSVFVLFLPGYSLLKALYPDRSLRPLEEFALSIGLSLALVPLIGLVLNYTPWGIRLVPVTISIAISTLTFSMIGLYRLYKSLS